MTDYRPTGTSPDAAINWRALRLFSLYRLVLSGLFVTLLIVDRVPPPLGSSDPELFQWVAFIYLGLAIAGQFAVTWRRPTFTIQVFGQISVDITAIVLLMHASGGISGGLGMLLVVAIAGATILTGGRTALLFAAMATLAVLAEQIYAWAYFAFPVISYTQSGLLGASFFATALLAHVLARRIRETEELAEQRGLDLANLARLNQHIVQRMRSGILVLDSNNEIRLVNDSAQRLLGLSREVVEGSIERLAPALAALIADWRRQPESLPRLFRPRRGEVDIRVSPTLLDASAQSGVLVFLEDASDMRQQAQQLKLASLGRLTASIAHEIRNPLGAISHAGQLLSESAQLADDSRRLTQIICDHSQRVNGIIENVLQLSRQQPTLSEPLGIRLWLDSFVDLFCSEKAIDRGQIVTDVSPSELLVRIDPSQLHQVLWNLCENGLRYSSGGPLLELRAGLSGELRRPYLDVINQGQPLTAQVAEQVFEPFFTTESSGSGLGLYIARELCEANQATLAVVDAGPDRCCFRISFAHPDRQQPESGRAVLT